VEVLINLVDYCRTSTVSMPDITPTYSEKFLWNMSYNNYPMASNSMNCGPIFHNVVGLPMPNPFMRQDQGIPNTLDIKTEATLLTHVGVYNYYIEACIVFNNGDSICDRTNDLQIEIKNPCLSTSISTESFAMLSATRMNIDGVLINFPFADSYDSVSSAYGVGKCGPQTLTIYDSITNQPVPWLTWNSMVGAITHAPLLDTPLGIRDYYYIVELNSYPGVLARQDFQAEVTACVVSSIQSNGASIPSRQLGWGDDAITVLATDAIGSFTQEPACGYDMIFTPKVVNPDNSITNLPIDNSLEFETSVVNGVT